MSTLPSTSVPPIQFTTAGLIIPQDQDILAGVQIDINYAFGGGVNPALETPQGQIASSSTAIISDKNSEIALIVNQFDPQYATGRFQDALARIYFLTRKGATSTVVTCDLGGLVGTVISAGTLARDTSNNTYTLLGTVTIGSASTVSSQWANIATGPIPCAAHSLNQVYQAVPGWDTIENSADGALGQDVETPSEFEFRRKNSVALNGRGTTQAIYANVFNVANVLDCFVVDNPSGNTIDYGATNYPLLPHSVYVAVLGGLDADIAQAIWSKKDTGCDYNGNTTVTVFDPSYTYPQPSYAVKFERTAPLAVTFQVTIVNSPSLAANTTALVRAAIVSRFNGTDGTNRERIGGTVLASRYYGAVAAIADNILLVGITVASATSLPIGIDQNPTLDPTDIAVTYA